MYVFLRYVKYFCIVFVQTFDFSTFQFHTQTHKTSNLNVLIPLDIFYSYK